MAKCRIVSLEGRERERERERERDDVYVDNCYVSLILTDPCVSREKTWKQRSDASALSQTPAEPRSHCPCIYRRTPAESVMLRKIVSKHCPTESVTQSMMDSATYNVTFHIQYRRLCHNVMENSTTYVTGSVTSNVTQIVNTSVVMKLWIVLVEATLVWLIERSLDYECHLVVVCDLFPVSW